MAININHPENKITTTSGELIVDDTLNIKDLKVGTVPVIDEQGNWVGPTVSSYVGSKGIQGSRGFTGSRGFVGSRGVTGSRGFSGYTGSRGTQGNIGFTGSRGFVGSRGSDGIAGSDGFTGSRGYNGSQGIVGVTGSRGSIGYTGSRGFRGSIGYTGSRGFRGSIGYTGSQGKGLSIKGSVGLISELPTVGNEIGDGYIVQENNNLYIWNGTSWIDSGKFTGYTGSRGYSGSRGYTGSQGFTGIITETSSIAPTSPIDGQMWFDTEDGTLKVYYNDGSSSQWIVISGPIGLKGYDGSNGYTGSRAYTGSRGFRGSIGYIGSQGFLGSFGYTGSRGFRGSQGFSGSRGFRGSIGYIGSQGFTGSQGINGFIGSRGFRGSKGFTGSQGKGLSIKGSVGLISELPTVGNEIGDGYIVQENNNLYIWNGTSWIDSGKFTGYTGSRGYSGSRGYTAFVNDIPPTTPVYGHIWLNTTDASLNVYYDDGSSSQWVSTSGPRGITGYTGSKAYTGSRGYTGSQGIQGYQGYTGSRAYTGSRGFRGSIGYIGSRAYTGSRGFIGYTGSLGIVGFTGSRGVQGQNGSPIGSIITTATSRLFESTDENCMIFSTSASAITFTIPLDSTLNFPIGTVVHITRDGAGSVTISNEVGVTVRIRNGLTNQLAVQYSTATAAKISANYWYLFGDLA